MSCGRLTNDAQYRTFAHCSIIFCDDAHQRTYYQTDTYCPSYSDAKYIVALYDFNMGIAEFVPVTSKSIQDLAAAVYTEWVCKYSIPARLTTMLDEDHNQALGQAIETCIGASTNLQISTVHEPSLPENLYRITTQLLQDTGLDWEDYIPALLLPTSQSQEPDLSMKQACPS